MVFKNPHQKITYAGRHNTHRNNKENKVRRNFQPQPGVFRNGTCGKRMDKEKPQCLPASPSADQLIMLVIVVMRLWRVLICWPGKPVLPATFINNGIVHTSTVGYFCPGSTCIQMMLPLQRSCHFTCSGLTKLPLYSSASCPRDDL